MSQTIIRLCAVLLLAVCAAPVLAQQSAAVASGTNSTAIVPPLVSFSGVLTNGNGQPLTGVVGVTFALYAKEQGGAPLWLETQNVYPDKTGHYTVLLGSTTSTGLPADLFAAGEARWLGVQVQGQAESPRILLASAPYALKAADAQTVGGLPASAFVQVSPSGGTAEPKGVPSRSLSKPGVTSNVAGTGTANYVPLWTDSSGDLGNSVVYQSGSGSTAKVGINTTTPTGTLGVNGTVSATSFNISGTRFAFGSNSKSNAFLGFAGNTKTTGTLNTATGWGAFFDNTTGSNNTADGARALYANTTGAYNTATGSSALQDNIGGSENTVVGYEAMLVSTTGNGNTAIGTAALTNSTSGSYNIALGAGSLLYNYTGSYNTGLGYYAGPDSASRNLTNATAIGANAVVSESNALVLGGTGANAVSVGIGTATPSYTLDVQGTGNFAGPVTFASGQAFPGTATLGANTFTGNQTVNGNLSATGLVTGAGFNIGSNLFDYGSYSLGNAFLGFAGNTSVAGANNTGIGYQALYSNIGDSAGDGSYNTALGVGALYSNNDTSNTGAYATSNTAVGYDSLYSNSTGPGNTATGYQALYSNTAGTLNTATGFLALQSNTGNLNSTTGSFNTASGSWALLANNGNSNTAIGVSALNENTTGNYNTAIGAEAGFTNQTGQYNTFVGSFAYVSSDNLTNATAIGARAYVSQSNTLVLGSINGVNNATSNTNVGIGTTAPDNLLTVNGTADKPGGGSWGTYSDRRLKTLAGNFNSGLSQILKLHPVRYRYNKENPIGIQDEQEHVGLVAQDVQEVIPEAVTENNKGYLLVNNDPIIWAMLNAIKEQQQLIRKQHEQIARLSSQVKAIRASLNVSGRTGSEVRTVKAQLTQQ